MSTNSLGDSFDIHGGGSDLLFPHHENEIAQSECATNSKFANYWLHNGSLRVDDKKMSKSLGNFFTLKEVLKKHKAEVVRYFLIASHYRSPINYTEQGLQQSAKALERIYICLKGLDVINAKSLTNSRYEKAFLAAMDDDFNTPEACSILFEMVGEVNKLKSTDNVLAGQLGKLIIRLGGILGLLTLSPKDFLMRDESVDVDEELINGLVAERNLARKDKNWTRADEIRDQLLAMKVVVEDGDSSSGWRIDR